LDLIVLATSNEGKARELSNLLHGLAHRVEFLRAHPEIQLPPETGSTYRENALAKARAVHDALRVPALGDDSGLEVDGLQGAPGLLSARYAGPNASDRANIDRLLHAMKGTPPERRSARFRCVLALVGASDTPIVVEGVCEGRILGEPRGSGGFGYDPVFVPEGESLTFAELSRERKDLLSHRGRAAKLLIYSL
jgi:XTP/dITP diphosphohydrolase